MRNIKNGYTLLFAVIVATVVLSIAAFILSISRKQFILSSAARDSSIAIYAADSGLECAKDNIDKFTKDSIYDNTVTQISCGNQSFSVYSSVASNFNSIYKDSVNPDTTLDRDGNRNKFFATSTFFLQNGSGSSCAWVKIGYDNQSEPIKYIIESRGYNIGYNNIDCSDAGPRKVERAFRFII